MPVLAYDRKSVIALCKFHLYQNDCILYTSHFMRLYNFFSINETKLNLPRNLGSVYCRFRPQHRLAYLPRAAKDREVSKQES